MNVRDPRHKSDHFMVVGCLCGDSPRNFFLPRAQDAHTATSARPSDEDAADTIFAELRRAVLNPDKRAARHDLWISAETWILVDERVSARQETGREQRRI